MRNLLADTGIPWLNTLTNAILNLINPILIVASIAGIVYAIWVGIKFVKADEKNEREEAKQKLIMVIVGIVVALLLIGLFYYLAYALQNNIINVSNWFNN